MIERNFAGLVEPELWAQVRQYAEKHQLVVRSYLMECTAHPMKFVPREGRPLAYSATVTFEKK